MKPLFLCLLLPFALTGCSHKSPMPIVGKASPPAIPSHRAVQPPSPPIVLDSKPPGALKYWKAGDDYISCLVFSPDGKRLATVDSSNNDVVQEWDAHTGKRLRSLHVADANLENVAYSPDGRWLAVTGAQNIPNAGANVYFWSKSSGKLIHTLTTGETYAAVQFTTNGRGMVTTDKFTDLWSTKTWLRTAHHSIPARNARMIAFSLDGKCLVEDSQAGQYTLRNIISGKTLAQWRKRPMQSFGYLSAVFSPSGKRLAAVALDSQFQYCSVEIRDADTGRLERTLRGKGVAVYKFIFSPTGKTLATYAFDTGYSDDGLTFWNIRTGAQKTIHNGGVMSAAFSPNGRVLAMGDTGGGVILWPVPRW